MMKRRKPKFRMGARNYPLRKIVGRRMEPLLLADGTPSEYLVQVEVLECGHTMKPRQDIYGEYNVSAKRRCTQCHKEESREGK